MGKKCLTQYHIHHECFLTSNILTLSQCLNFPKLRLNNNNNVFPISKIILLQTRYNTYLSPGLQIIEDNFSYSHSVIFYHFHFMLLFCSLCCSTMSIFCLKIFDIIIFSFLFPVIIFPYSG